MWKVSCFYEKVHDFANFGGYAAILINKLTGDCHLSYWTVPSSLSIKLKYLGIINCSGQIIAKELFTKLCSV